MTLEQRLKDLESINHVSKSEHVDLLIQALRKAIEQRDWWLKNVTIVNFNTFKEEEDKELLEILEGE